MMAMAKEFAMVMMITIIFLCFSTKEGHQREREILFTIGRKLSSTLLFFSVCLSTDWMNKSSSSGQICRPQLKSKSNPTAISQLKSILALTGQWKKSRKKVAMRKNRIFPFSVSVNRIFFTFPFLFRQKFLCSCTGAMGTVIRGENKKEKVVKKRWQHQTKITYN